MLGKGCDWMGFEGQRDWVWGAVKEREGSNETIDRIDKAGKGGRHTEEMLACHLLEPVETHVDRLKLLRPNRRSRKTDRAFNVDE
jgi:hypothetical protein